MNTKQKYNRIDQSKLDDRQIEILKIISKKTNDFKTKDKDILEKIDVALDDIIRRLEEKNPDALKPISKRTSTKVVASKSTRTKTKRTQKSKATKTTSSTAKSSGNNIMSVAKEIRKAGETFKDAMERAKQVLKERREGVVAKKKSELEKLYALVKTKKELQGFTKSDLRRDAVRTAKPRGARVVTKEGSTSNAYGTFPNKLGRKYWETRDRHADRLAPNYPKDMPLLAGGGAVSDAPFEVFVFKSKLRFDNELPSSSKGDFPTFAKAKEFAIDMIDSGNYYATIMNKRGNLWGVSSNGVESFANGGSFAPNVSDGTAFMDNAYFANGGDTDEKYDDVFVKIYNKYNDKNYFGEKEQISNMLRNWQSALDKGDKNAEKYTKEDVIRIVKENNISDSYNGTYLPLKNAVKNSDKNFLKSRIRYDQKFTKDLYEELTGNNLPNTNKEIQNYFDSKYANGGGIDGGMNNLTMQNVSFANGGSVNRFKFNVGDKAMVNTDINFLNKFYHYQLPPTFEMGYDFSKPVIITERFLNSKNKPFYELKTTNGYVVNGSLPQVLLSPVNSSDKYSDVKIKDWYTKTYPTDDLGEKLDEDATFEDVWTAVNKGANVYSVFGIGDSVIRERIFDELSKIYGVDYGFIYKKWLKSDDYANGGGIDGGMNNLTIQDVTFGNGGSVSNERMFNFLNDDLGKLEEAIKDGDFEEVNRFFSYWLGSSGHLKSLETKTNERMYNFLKEDLEKLMEAVENDDTEEVERFFSYWGQHLESLKMADGGEFALYKIQQKYKYDLQPKWEDEKFQTGGRKFLTFAQAQDFKKKLQGLSSSMEYKVVKVGEDEKLANGGSLYSKATKSQYLEKYSKNGNLVRTAEQFDSGNWVVSVYSGVDVSGEYSNEEFNKKIKKYFNKYADGGSLPFMTDPNFGDFQNTGSFANGGSVQDLVKNAENSGAKGFVERKGEVLDFDNGSYLIENDQFVKLVDGKIAYTPIEMYKGYSIKYNKNGVHYFAIFKGSKSLEDHIYSIADSKRAIDEMKGEKFELGGAFMTDPNFGDFQNTGSFANGGLLVNNTTDLEEVAKYMFTSVKKRSWDLRDLIHYFNEDNGFDYRNSVKVWDDMNGYEMRKTYDNILDMLKRIVEANNKKFELGGAFMMTDLAGHTGGGTGGLNGGMPLSGTSGTYYTGLVGETGAMSSGELFENGGGVEEWKKAITIKRKTREEAEKNKELLKEYWGKSGRNFKVEKRDNEYVISYEFHIADKMELGGAMMQNQQVINDASQPYVITEAFGNPAQQIGMLAKGGTIKNQYEGRTAKDVWNNWTGKQRYHFLLDHENRFPTFKDKIFELKNVEFDKLPIEIYLELDSHVMRGQYAKGGGIPNNYQGRTPEDVWNDWTEKQKIHFLLDHISNKEIVKSSNLEEICKLTGSELMDFENRKIIDGIKAVDIRNALVIHVREGQYASGGSLGKALYVEYSSYFDYNKYDEEKIMSALKSIGAKNIHLENDGGMSNQPEVVVFNGSKRQAEDALNEAFDTDYILIYEKDWRTKKMADGGFTPDVSDGTQFMSGVYAKGGETSRKGTYTNRIVILDNGDSVMIGNISGYRGTGEPVYDVHKYGSLRKNMLEKQGELSNNKIKELLKKDKYSDGGFTPDVSDGTQFMSGVYADGGSVGDDFEEAIDLGSEQYYTRPYGVVESESKGEVELVVVATIKDLEDYVSEDELPEEGNFQLDITLVPTEQFISEEILESANDEDSSSISDDSVLNVVNYAGGLNYSPQERVFFETHQDALDYLMSDELKEQINRDSFSSDYIMYKQYNRLGQRNFEYLDYLMGVSDRFAKGGLVGAVEFNAGDIVWQKDEKEYAFVMNNYGDPVNGNYGDIRLDTTGNTSIYSHDPKRKTPARIANATGYNLIKLGEKGDTGKFTPEVLAEMKERGKRYLDFEKRNKGTYQKENIAYIESVVRRILDGEFDSMVKGTAKPKKYIDHDDIESVTLNVKGNFVTFAGKDFLNGANLMEKGGDLSKIATYFPIRDIVKVTLKNGDIIKPLNGYWLKNGSEPMGKKTTPNSPKTPTSTNKTSLRTLVKKFETEKPSIALGVIVTDVVEDFMREKFDKTVDWEKLSSKEKEDYNKEYQVKRDNFRNYLDKEFLNNYYSDENLRKKLSGDSRKTIDLIKVELVKIAKTYDYEKYANGGSFAPNVSDGTAFMDNAYFANGGFVGTVEFNAGDIVWQKDEKRYAFVMNNYGDPINGSSGEIRLDTTGNTPIFTYNKDFTKETGYNLVKLGEKGDTGKFTPEVLAEMKEQAKKYLNFEKRAKGSQQKENIAYIEKVVRRTLDGEFDSMVGRAKSTTSNKKGSRDYTYVPNKDVKELSVVLKGELKELMGSDILDGVYVKNSAKGKGGANAETIFAKILKDAKEAKSGKAKRFDASELKILNLEMIQKLVEAGYTEQQIRNVIFGYTFDNEVLAEGEFDTQSGLFGYDESYIPKKIDSLVDAKKNSEFVVGIKYPDFDWQGIIKKYKISSKPKEIVIKRRAGSWGHTEYFYEVFVGENIVIGHNYGYKDFDVDGKLKDDYIEKDKKVSDPTKQNAWQKEREQKAGFNGGYWYVVSSKIEIIDDVLKTLLSQKDGYCKELDFYDDSFPKNLKENKIAFADGGSFAPNVSDGTQFMNEVYADGGQMQVNNIDAELEDFDLDNLDDFETMQYNHAIKSFDKVGALQILINTVEGDYSKLSPELAELAEMQISQEQWDEASREMYGYANGGSFAPNVADGTAFMDNAYFADGGGIEWDKDSDSIRAEMGEFKIMITPQNQRGYYDINVKANNKTIGNEYDIYGIDNAKNKAYEIISESNKFANGGGVSDYMNSPEYKEMVDNMQKLTLDVKGRVVRAIGLDSAIEFYDAEYPIRPYQLLEKAVRKGFITLDEINERVIDSAMETAQDSEDMEEIGSSDETYAMQEFLDEAGFKTVFVEGRLLRVYADGGGVDDEMYKLAKSIVRGSDYKIGLYLPYRTDFYLKDKKGKFGIGSYLVLQDEDNKNEWSVAERKYEKSKGGYYEDIKSGITQKQAYELVKELINSKYADGGFMNDVYADGGEIRRFNRQEQMDSKTREEVLDVLSEPKVSGVLTNYLYGLFDGYDYSETENFKKELSKLKSKDSALYDRVNNIYKIIEKYKFEKYDEYADGGLLSNNQIEKLDRGFTIPQLNDMLDEMFPDSFRFEVYKQEQSTIFRERLHYEYDNKVKDDKLKLYFHHRNYGRDLNYEVHQGQENTYFKFQLVDEEVNTYVGTFGFKDEGDVDASYITKFISFLQDAFHYPLQVKHFVMADGGSFAPNVSDGTQFMNDVYAKGGVIKIGDNVRSTVFKGRQGEVISKGNSKGMGKKYYFVRLDERLPNGDYQHDIMWVDEVEKMANGGMFDNNDGFMPMKNGNNYRYPEREVYVETIDEPIDLTSNVGSMSDYLKSQYIEDDIDFTDDKRIRARLTQPNRGSAESFSKINPRAYEFINTDLPTPTSNTHKND